MRAPEATYDGSLNQPDPNQEDAAEKLFAFAQELRKQASASDPDSPDELTFQEIVTAAVQHVPGSAMAIMAMLRDESKLASDIEAIGHIISRQLGVYGST